MRNLPPYKSNFSKPGRADLYFIGGGSTRPGLEGGYTRPRFIGGGGLLGLESRPSGPPHSGTFYVQECETTYRQNYTSNQHNDILQIGQFFCSILPISLQPIAYEKIHAQHSNELAKGYTLIPITIFIDKCLLGDIEKLVVFSRICRISMIFGSILLIKFE